jgi:hypothetical protein
VEVEEVISSEDEEEVGLGGEKQDLQLEATAVAPLAQGRRSLAITYSSRKKNVSTPSLPMRKSSRNGTLAGTPILELAQRRAEERNLEADSISKKKDKGNDFEILDVLSDAHLSSVVRDSCLVFNPVVGPPEAALSLMRAKELAQGALAEAARRAERQIAEELEVAEAQRAATHGEVTITAEAEGSVDAAAAREASRPVGSPVARDSPSGDAVGSAQGGVEAGTARPRRKCVKKSQLTVRKGQHKRKGAK